MFNDCFIDEVGAVIGRVFKKSTFAFVDVDNCDDNELVRESLTREGIVWDTVLVNGTDACNNTRTYTQM